MTSHIDIEASRKKNMRAQREAAERSAAAFDAKLKAERRAFKAAGGHAYPTDGDDETGMTLREHYAGLAMQGLMQAHASQGTSPMPTMSELCRQAVSAADDLLHALEHNKTEDQP
jgi:hypothetical protein